MWLTADQVRFRVWAPHGETVRVEYPDREPTALLREPDAPGFWSAVATGLTPGDRYRILLTSSWNDCFHQEGAELRRRDPYARETEFDTTWCLLPLPHFPWSEFQPPPLADVILYELHLGSFPDPGAGSVFTRAEARLEHIQALGFNTIQLMPVTEFGGLWGYNPRQLLAVHSPWGSALELKNLIDRAHRLGLAVVIDLVLNHGSARLNALWNWDGYGPQGNGGIYFEGERDTPWGRRFAFHKPEVQAYLLAACRLWLEEYRADGLRFDSVHNMPWETLTFLTSRLGQEYPGKYLIAEITPENPSVVTHGGFHSCWRHAAHFDSLKVMAGHNSAAKLGLLKALVNLPAGFPDSGSVINSVLGSHDQCGDRYDGQQDGGCHRYYIARLGGRHNWHGRAQVRMWYAIQGLSRGLPMLFMGSETLQDGWWHLDEGHRFAWRLLDEGDSLTAEMVACVGAVNRLRSANAALRSEQLRVVHEDCNHPVLGWLRYTENKEEVLLCVANLSEAQWLGQEYGLATGWGGGRSWRQVFNSQAPAFGGWAETATPGTVGSGDDGCIHINLPKWSVLVFTLC